ncbi:MAG TPA: hypothetical protein EYH31_02945 [Anaerolineae bacterium]|nr:hypothetical protein [Anaerolineae bacterium]
MQGSSKQAGWLCVVIVLVAAFVIAWGGHVRSVKAVSPTPQAKIVPALWARLVGGSEADFLVVLREQADVSGAAQLSDKHTKGRYVYDRLREVAQRTQAPLRAELDYRGIRYRSFYLVNMIQVHGNASLALALAERPEVARLTANPHVTASLPRPDLERSTFASGLLAPEALPWGIRYINADDLWTRYGIRGQQIVIAGQDTGYQWDHPALKEHYRGWDAAHQTVDHNYNWHDAIHNDIGHANSNVCGYDSSEPCDDHGHGTHTMGTMVGDDGANHHIGVAPGARWIGCRNMDNGDGTPATYTECFEFFLAPYPLDGDPMTDGDPDQAPHIINNSWGCPPSEGCDVDTLQQVVENVRAAGILVVVSAGNSGSSCSSVHDPPAVYDTSFSVGAFDNQGTIASFSARGPVTADGSSRRKPDIAAPGVDVYSSVPGSGYAGGWQGTSMAAPHVAGTAALLLSAAPWLIGDVDAIEQTIEHSAHPRTTTQGCGSDTATTVPNNVWGWGAVDALTAVETVRPPGALAGQVTKASTGAPLAGAALSITDLSSGASLRATTNVAGRYTVTLLSGSYVVTATVSGYRPIVANSVTVVSRTLTLQDFILEPDITPTPSPTPTPPPVAQRWLPLVTR